MTPNQNTYSIQRNIPTADRYDVVVVGGGMAGIGAACAAAREGARTLLIERFAQTGGMGSLAAVGNWCYCGPLEGQGVVFDQLMGAMGQIRGIGPEHGWPVTTSKPPVVRDNNLFDHTLLPIAGQHLLDRAGVDVLFHTEVVDTVMSGQRIDALVVHNRSLLQAIEAGMVIDATGDGLVAQHAGATVLPRESEDLMPAGFMIFLRPVEHAELMPLLEESVGELPHNWSFKGADGLIAIKCRVYGNDTGTGHGVSAAEQSIRRDVLRIVRHYQETKGQNVKLDQLPPMIGVREGRRIEGEYVLTLDDVDAERRFDDAIAFGAFTIDTVEPGSDRMVPPYQIPFRSLIARHTENLLLAGRCISTDRLTMSSARVMATSCMVGQASGIAAASALRRNESIRRIDAALIRGKMIETSAHPRLIEHRLGSA